MLFLYRIGIRIYSFLIWSFTPFHPKAKAFSEGRKGLFLRLETDLKARKGRLIWIHAASLGEFEQGRPVIEELKQEHSDVSILLTFFSPSGYQVKKNDPIADFIHYLPLDTQANAYRFLEIVRPDIAIFIKYEFWYFHLKALQQRKIPTYIVSAIFRADQWFFHRSAAFFREILRGISHFFVQDKTSERLLNSIGVRQLTLAGDTRYDRVLNVEKALVHIPILRQFKSDQPLMVLGSTWHSDMEILQPFIQKNQSKLKFVIAPHQIGKKEIADLLKLPGSISLSEMEGRNPELYRILIIDRMGLLSSIYRYGDYAYVGGGFRGTLHNTLEAAVYGLPVFFGYHRNNRKFAEAAKLEKEGGGFPVRSEVELQVKFNELRDNPVLYQKAVVTSKKLVRDGGGATKKIITLIKQTI